jgi:hypothetical protein
MNRQQAIELLRESIEKQVDLRKKSGWQQEIPERCPPVLWFGDSTAESPFVLTVGANPSREEYLEDSSDEALAKVRQSGDQSNLSYLSTPRFYMPTSDTSLAEVAEDDDELEAILEGYDNYFEQNPYQTWFGHPKSDSYKVEGFLRGFGGSYYNDSLEYQALHVDLFPFVTLSDFGDLEDRANQDLFQNGWASSFLKQLVDLLDPEIIAVFGDKNVGHYESYVDDSIEDLTWITYPHETKHHTAYYKIGRTQTLESLFVGLTPNLGHPPSYFDSEGIKEFGGYIRSELEQWK